MIGLTSASLSNFWLCRPTAATGTVDTNHVALEKCYFFLSLGAFLPSSCLICFFFFFCQFSTNSAAKSQFYQISWGYYYVQNHALVHLFFSEILCFHSLTYSGLLTDKFGLACNVSVSGYCHHVPCSLILHYILLKLDCLWAI